MSSEEIKDKKRQEEISQEDIEAKIEAAMAQIIADETEPEEAKEAEETEVSEFLEEQEVLEEQEIVEEQESLEEQVSPEEQEIPEEQVSPEPSQAPASPAAPQRTKSARPTKINYVSLEDDDLVKPLQPVHRKKHKGLKGTGFVIAMAVVAAVTAYGGISYYYADKFFEGTTINGLDCSGKTAYEVEQMIAQNVENYTIQVASRNLEPQTIVGRDIDYRYLSNGEVLALLKEQKPYEWVKGFIGKTEYTTAQNVAFDKKKLETQIKSLNCANPENQIAPEDAYVAFHNTEFVIVPETEGSQLDVKQAYRVLEEAVSTRAATVDFGTAPQAYKTAAVTSQDQSLKAAVDAYNNFARASITYTFGEETVTLDGATIKNWLQFDEKGQLVQDDTSFQQQIRDFVAQLAAEHDTVGTTQEFTATDGRTVYVHSYAYGWKIDQEAEATQLAQEIQSGAQITREPVYEMTANSHGYNSLGDTYIEVDLTTQHMYYYQGGSIIFDSDIVSGNMSYADRQTPPGIFTLYYKNSPDVLRGEKRPDGTYEYEEPVQYWMPFNGGIGFHDAPWQPYFGGDRYLTGGSHGCINMPPENAGILYSIIDYNVPIICFY